MTRALENLRDMCAEFTIENTEDLIERFNLVKAKHRQVSLAEWLTFWVTRTYLPNLIISIISSIPVPCTDLSIWFNSSVLIPRLVHDVYFLYELGSPYNFLYHKNFQTSGLLSAEQAKELWNTESQSRFILLTVITDSYHTLKIRIPVSRTSG